MAENKADLPGGRCSGTVRIVAKKAAIIGLVLLIVLLAIPLGMAMAISGCPECPAVGTSHALGLCMTLEAMVLLVVALGLLRIGASPTRGRALLLARTLERPPRTV